MTLLLFMVSGAFWLGLLNVLGWPAVVIVATVATATVCIAVVSGEARAALDRRTAYRRWEAWHG